MSKSRHNLMQFHCLAELKLERYNKVVLCPCHVRVLARAIIMLLCLKKGVTNKWMRALVEVLTANVIRGDIT
jgi:hypothetical protein